MLDSTALALPLVLLAPLGALAPSSLDGPQVDRLGDPLPAGAVARLGTSRFSHPTEVRFVCVTPDGRFAISGDVAGRVRIWNTVDASLVRELELGRDPLVGGAVDPRGGRVAVGDVRGRQRLIGVPGGALLLDLPGVGGLAAWSADGARLATAGEGTGLALIDVDVEGAPVRVLEGGAHALTSPAFTADGRFVAAIEVDRDVLNGREHALGGAPSTVRVWDATSGEVSVAWPLASELATALVPTSDGGLAVGTNTGRLFLAPTVPGALVEASAVAPGPIRAGTAGLRGPWFALGTGGFGQLGAGGFEHHPGTTCDGLDEDGAGALLVRHATGLARFVPVDSSGTAAGTGAGALRAEPDLPRHGAPVSAVDLSDDGALALTAAHDGVLRLWDVAGGALVLEARGHTGLLFGCDLAPDSGRFASGGRDGTARIWSAATGRELIVLGPFSRAVTDVAFDPTGERLAVAVADGSLWSFDTRTGAELWHVEGLGGASPCLAWSPNGASVAFAARGLTVRDAASGAERWRLDGLGSPVGAVAWSPDGAQLALGLAGRAAVLVDSATHEVRLELGPLSGRATGVAFPVGGLELLTTAYNGRGPERWELVTGVARSQRLGHGADALCAAAAGGVPRAITGGADGLGLVWSTAP